MSPLSSEDWRRQENSQQRRQIRIGIHLAQFCYGQRSTQGNRSWTYQIQNLLRQLCYSLIYTNHLVCRVQQP